MQRSARLPLALGLAFAAASLFAQGLTLRVASFVPANSPWDTGLKRLAAEFDRISAGRVKIVFPQSLKASSESDIIQKMRLGVDGALLTTMGIAEIYPDSLALSMPSVVRDDAELDAVLAVVEPRIKEQLAANYAVLAVAKGGWVRYFSNAPINYPADLAKLRMSVNPSDEKIARLMQSIGAKTVKGGLSSLVLQLSSKSIDGCYLSPIFAAGLWAQLQGKLNYMSSFRVSPFFGSILFTRQAWDKVPADLKPQLEAAARRIAQEMAAETGKLEESSIANLQKSGLVIPPYPADAQATWDAVYAERRASVVSGMFSKDFMALVDEAVSKVRKSK